MEVGKVFNVQGSSPHRPYRNEPDLFDTDTTRMALPIFRDTPVVLGAATGSSGSVSQA